jgi:hypothetical protein
MELIRHYLSSDDEDDKQLQLSCYVRGSAWIDDKTIKSSFGTRCRFIITAAIFMFCHVTSRETNLAVGMLH